MRICFFLLTLSFPKLKLLNVAANCANPIFLSTNKGKTVALNSATECTLAFTRQYAECYK